MFAYVDIDMKLVILSILVHYFGICKRFVVAVVEWVPVVILLFPGFFRIVFFYGQLATA